VEPKGELERLLHPYPGLGVAVVSPGHGHPYHSLPQGTQLHHSLPSTTHSTHTAVVGAPGEGWLSPLKSKGKALL